MIKLSAPDEATEKLPASSPLILYESVSPSASEAVAVRVIYVEFSATSTASESADHLGALLAVPYEPPLPDE